MHRAAHFSGAGRAAGRSAGAPSHGRPWRSPSMATGQAMREMLTLPAASPFPAGPGEGRKGPTVARRSGSGKLRKAVTSWLPPRHRGKDGLFQRGNQGHQPAPSGTSRRVTLPPRPVAVRKHAAPSGKSPRHGQESMGVEKQEAGSPSSRADAYTSVHIPGVLVNSGCQPARCAPPPGVRGPRDRRGTLPFGSMSCLPRTAACSTPSE
jgi:hypothetical protein